MFDEHNPLKHFDFETDDAVATWPAGGDEFNRDYTMKALGDEVTQIYTDGGWVSSVEGYDSKGMLGVGGSKVEEEGNRMLFFNEDKDNIEPDQMMFTGPEIFNYSLAELSGEGIEMNGLEDGEIAVVQESDDGYQLRSAEDPEAMEDCIAFGYADAFNDGFPVITVENARDAYMALAYDEDFQEGLDERHRKVKQREKDAEAEVREEFIDNDNWERPKHRDNIDEKKVYGLEQALAETYANREGEYPERWDSERDFNRLHPGDLEELTKRGDRISAMAENILELQKAKRDASKNVMEASREDLLPEFLGETWYNNVVKASARLRDKAHQNDKEFLAVHDVHDAFHSDMQGTKFENPNLSDSRKLSVLIEASEREFENVNVYGIPWDEEVDGKEQSMEIRDDFQELFPTYEDIIPDEDLPVAIGTGITRGTPFRPVIALSDEPVDVEGDDLIDLSDIV